MNMISNNAFVVCCIIILWFVKPVFAQDVVFTGAELTVLSEAGKLGLWAAVLSDPVIGP